MLEKSKFKIVIGVIGLGVGAFHLQNSLAYKNCKVKYICDKNKKRLFYYKNKFKIQNATIDFNEVVNDKEVNVIIIASNDDDHFYQIIKSLKNDKHVFIEKPMCLSLKDLKNIIKIKKKKTKIMYFLQLSFENTSIL